MSYAKLLYTLPTDRLREVVQRRARTIRAIPPFRDKRHLCEFLADALSAPPSIGDALEATDRLQLQILTFAIVEGGTVTFDALVARMGEEARKRIWTAANELESLGLVVLTRVQVSSEHLGSDRALFVPGAVRIHTPLPLPLRRMLPSAMQNYDVPTIGVIYQTLGLPAGEATTKAARIDRITEVLTDTERVRNVLTGLDQATVAMLNHVVQRGGAMTLSEIALRLDSRQRNQLYSYDWSRRWYHGKPRNAVEELLARGILIFDGAVGWGYGHILVPGNVLSALTGKPLFAGSAVDVPAWETLPAEGAAIHRHDSLCRDVAYLMGFLGRTEATRTSKGTIHRNVLKSLAKGLTEPTTDYAHFVYAIAREADLIGPQGRGALYDVTEQGIAWLDLPVEQQLRSLYEVWRVQAAWSENSQDPLTDSVPFYAADETRALRECGVTLCRELYSERPNDLASIRSLAAGAEFRWWSRFAPSEADEADELAGQSSSAEQYLSRLLAGSLYWLGLTEKAEANGSMFVRTSDRGAATLGFRDSAPVTVHQTIDRFVLQPNLEIYAPPNLLPSLLYRLFRIAEPSSRGGSLLTLSADTLRRALDRGETSDSILELFRAHSQTGVPQNVEYLINQVGGMHGHIHIGQAGLYIQVSDPVLLKEIQAQKKLNIHVRRQLTDTVALVTGDSVDAILKQLRQAGYLPVSDEDRHAPTTPAAAKHPYKPPVVARKQSVQSAPHLDWDAIAAEDGQRWDEPQQAVPIERAATEAQARQLLDRAAKERLVVAVRYQPDARAPSDEREIEPIGVAGSLLRAYDRGKRAPVLFNVRYITSIRTTGERFDADS